MSVPDSKREIYWFTALLYIMSASGILSKEEEERLSTCFKELGYGDWKPRLRRSLGLHDSFVKSVFCVCRRHRSVADSVGVIMRGVGAPEPNTEFWKRAFKGGSKVLDFRPEAALASKMPLDLVNERMFRTVAVTYIMQTVGALHPKVDELVRRTAFDEELFQQMCEILQMDRGSLRDLYALCTEHVNKVQSLGFIVRGLLGIEAEKTLSNLLRRLDPARRRRRRKRKPPDDPT
jgi:hypothetical protein